MGWKEWLTPLQIPERTMGDYEVRTRKQPAGWVATTAPARAVVLGGQRGERVLFPCRTLWHELHYSGGCWMTDVPAEQAQMRSICAQATGNVLVAGLGLGLAVKILLSNPAVKTVTTVEVSMDVIHLVWPHTLGRHKSKSMIVHGDAFEFFDQTSCRYDSVVLDIWQGDGEATLVETVIPLRKAAARVTRGSITAWNEDVMRGQVLLGLRSNVQMLIAGLLPSDQSRSLLEALCDQSVAAPTHALKLPFWTSVQDRLWPAIGSQDIELLGRLSQEAYDFVARL